MPAARKAAAENTRTAKPAAPPKLSFRPADKATRDDFLAVFEGPGGPKYCWCMAWRQTNAEVKASNEERRAAMLGRIDRGAPIGLVGYADKEPVAWVSIAPRDTYRNLGGPEAGSGEVIWSIVCMYLRRTLRGAGAAHAMIDAAVKHAQAEGATVVEAYPVDPDSPSYRFGGFVPAYAAAGFEEVGRTGTRRHVMRLTLTRGRQRKS